MEAVLVALITAGFGYLGAREHRNAKKIDQLGREWTENHHSNAEPTVKDFLTDIRDEGRETRKILTDHIQWHLDQKD